MRTICFLFLLMSWAAWMQGADYAFPLRIRMRATSWSAVAAATAFDSSGEFATRQGGSCCYRTPRRLRCIYFHGSESAEPLSSTGDAGHAASPRDEASPAGGQESEVERNHRPAPGRNHAPRRMSLTKLNHPLPLPNSRPHPLSGNYIHQAGSTRPVGAARSGLIANETVHNPLLVRTSSVARPAAPSSNNVRHRGPNPPVVGGSPNLRSRNSGVINGTQLHRK
jgi:hypothetical protein